MGNWIVYGFYGVERDFLRLFRYQQFTTYFDVRTTAFIGQIAPNSAYFPQ